MMKKKLYTHTKKTHTEEANNHRFEEEEKKK